MLTCLQNNVSMFIVCPNLTKNLALMGLDGQKPVPAPKGKKQKNQGNSWFFSDGNRMYSCLVYSSKRYGTVEKLELTACHSERSEESPYKSKRFFGRGVYPAKGGAPSE